MRVETLINLLVDPSSNGNANQLTTDNNKHEVVVTIPKNHLPKDERMLVIPGMIAQVSVQTNKRSIMSYLLKPILKAKRFSLGER